MSVEAPIRQVRQAVDRPASRRAALEVTGIELLRLLWRKRRLMYATTTVELKKRYSGALLGQLWIVLHPILFLSVYMFVYLLVFKVSAPGKSGLEYVLFIFSGLVPFLAFMEVFSASCVAIKQNTAMIRNVILPIEFLPLRTVCMAMVAEAAGLAMVVIMAFALGAASWHLLWLPAVVILQALMFAGIALFMASLGVAVPDLGYISGIIAIALLLVSPIAYTLDMVPAGARFITYANPFTYMMEMFRASLVEGHWPRLDFAAVYVLSSLGTFAFGNAAFTRFRSTIDDHV